MFYFTGLLLRVALLELIALICFSWVIPIIYRIILLPGALFFGEMWFQHSGKLFDGGLATIQKNPNGLLIFCVFIVISTELDSLKKSIDTLQQQKKDKLT